jgi:hypothetical protein
MQCVFVSFDLPLAPFEHGRRLAYSGGSEPVSWPTLLLGRFPVAKESNMADIAHTPTGLVEL